MCKTGHQKEEKDSHSLIQFEQITFSSTSWLQSSTEFHKEKRKPVFKMKEDERINGQKILSGSKNPESSTGEAFLTNIED